MISKGVNAQAGPSPKLCFLIAKLREARLFVTLSHLAKGLGHCAPHKATNKKGRPVTPFYRGCSAAHPGSLAHSL